MRTLVRHARSAPSDPPSPPVAETLALLDAWLSHPDNAHDPDRHAIEAIRTGMEEAHRDLCVALGKWDALRQIAEELIERGGNRDD